MPIPKTITLAGLFCMIVSAAALGNEPLPANRDANSNKPAGGPAVGDKMVTPPKPAPQDPADRRRIDSHNARDKADRMRARYEAEVRSRLRRLRQAL